jgi:hypothetical protein
LEPVAALKCRICNLPIVAKFGISLNLPFAFLFGGILNGYGIRASLVLVEIVFFANLRFQKLVLAWLLGGSHFGLLAHGLELWFDFGLFRALFEGHCLSSVQTLVFD